MNDLQVAFGFLSTALDLIPKVVSIGNKIDEMQREHDEKMSLKYSESEYLKTVLSLYKSRKITAEEARKTLCLIFRDEPVTVTALKRSDSIESEIYRLLGNY